jgi:hypothetical protein
MLKGRALGDPGQENRGLKGLEELLNTGPFEEYECAMWALRIERRKLVAVHTLDLFGLATYPTEAHQRSGLPVAGKLAFSVHGHDELSIDLLDLLDAAKRWWANFRGLTLRGRPKGTGAWATREDLVAALEEAVTKSPRRASRCDFIQALASYVDGCSTSRSTGKRQESSSADASAPNYCPLFILDCPNL